ncbi:MAG: DUF1801 domain-containing protein [Alphaproteobacteria bacterium]|nr:DUF1801 domain-containing protein [Alphaproteobacteria bacterium]
MADLSPKKQLDGFIAKFSPEVATATKKALAAMRKRLPGALELVYDNYNALAIAYGPTERTSEVIFSIAVYPRWVSLFFYYGAKLKDPKKILKGSGTQVRHIVLDTTARLANPDISALMDQALAQAKVPLDPKQKSRIVIKSISAKQRPRRPT